jgi:pimeloyl-ACP methyl ester carboxylesterase
MMAASAGGAALFATAALAETIGGGGEPAIRPFHAQFDSADVADLQRRIRATRWPDRETVGDRSQGVQLAGLQELVRFWGSGYDFGAAMRRMNAWPQFLTEIDGLDIHFVHVKSRHPNALPLIITHGWPGSYLEQLGVVGPLTDPTAHGGRPEDAFDVVIPSLPGFGFSGKPTQTGWDPDRIGRAWGALMARLGYRRYVAQGGDWGSPISEGMGRQGVPGLVGLHVNLPATVPGEIGAALANGTPPPGLPAAELEAFKALVTFSSQHRAYSVMMQTRPQTIGYALTDSPVGLAAWMYDYNDGEPQRLLGRQTFLDNVTLYWLTNTAASSARIYWENGSRNLLSPAAQGTSKIAAPVAVTVFPDEIYRAPESWARRAFPTLAYFHEVDRGGHFAAWEQPELFAAEMRAAFRSLRT